MLAAGAGLLGAAVAHGGDASAPIRNGGTFRISLVEGFGNGRIDPALVDLELMPLLDTTCLRLMTYPDKAPPEGFRLTPEMAKRYPTVSRDGRTYTFTLRRGFRFSDRASVRASAFARAIVRVLKLDPHGAGALLQDIVGADRVQEGRAETVDGIAALGYRLVIKLTRPAPAFPARLTAPWFCAVPPRLPAHPEGVATFAAAGPYYVAENVHGRRLVLKRNRYYGGRRPHHVESFVIDGQAGSWDEVLDRVEQGRADWGSAPPGLYLDPQRRLIAKYGRNRSRFFLEPGLTFRHFHLNVSRGLFRNNPKLRRAVNFAIDRRAVQRTLEGPLGGRLTDQYLPPRLFPGFNDADIYPLRRPNIRKARALARGHTKSGKAALYTYAGSPFIAAGQVVKRNLARIGIDVEVNGIPDYYGRLIGNLDEPWDIAFAEWAPDHLDPYGYLNALLDGQFIREVNLSHFNSPKYNRLLRRAARLRGDARYRAYGKLDVRITREAAPMVAISYLNQPTLVSKRVDPRCVVLRPTLDLTAVCLKR
jgi:peptide/nickel transport system substrate-binding protein